MGLGEEGLDHPSPAFKTEKIPKKGPEGQTYSKLSSGPVPEEASTPVSEPVGPEYSQQPGRFPVGIST